MGFLLRLVSADGHALGAWTFQSMSDDMESLCLVRECRKLEKIFQTHYTDKIPRCGNDVNVKDEGGVQDRQADGVGEVWHS